MDAKKQMVARFKEACEKAKEYGYDPDVIPMELLFTMPIEDAEEIVAQELELIKDSIGLYESYSRQ